MQRTGSVCQADGTRSAPPAPQPGSAAPDPGFDPRPPASAPSPWPSSGASCPLACPARSGRRPVRSPAPSSSPPPAQGSALLLHGVPRAGGVSRQHLTRKTHSMEGTPTHPSAASTFWWAARSWCQCQTQRLVLPTLMRNSMIAHDRKNARKCWRFWLTWCATHILMSSAAARWTLTDAE